MNFNTFKKAAVTVVISAGLTVASVPAAIAGGIPTYDSAAVAQAIQQGVQLKEQIDNQIDQINRLKEQIKALTGNRNLGNILKTEALEQMPDEWKKVYEAAQGFKSGNYSGLLSSKNYNGNADNERLVKYFDLTLRSIKDSELRMKNIRALMNEVNKTQDMKAAADLQNRIALESSIIQQNQTNLDTLARFMELDEKIQFKKRQARDSCIRQNRINNTNKSCV